METWSKIRGIENYEISNLNNIRSIDRTIFAGNSVRLIKGKLMRLGTLKKGYRTITLCENGKIRNYLLHQLIALNAFENYNPAVDHIDHIDRNVNNNSIDNLRVVTNRMNHQNRKDMSATGTGIYFEKNKYTVRIWNKDRFEYLGRYVDIEDAQIVHNEALMLIENNNGCEFVKIKIAPLQYKLIIK